MLSRLALLFLCFAVSTTCCSQAPERFDVLITELLPDPSPALGLPAAEFMELKNVSTAPVNLGGWRVSNGSATASISTGIMLLPDSMIIICGNSSVSLYQPFGRTVGVSNFPSLDNESGVVVLQSAGGKTIHAVAYTQDLYGSSIKSEGGWSLELIDPGNPCGGGNWKASIDNKGGTPGKSNSVNGPNPDSEAPRLKRSYARDSNTLVLVFNESLDSISTASTSNFHLSNNLHVSSAAALPPLFQSVELKLSGPLTTITSSIEVKGIKDCSGNFTGVFNNTAIGLAVPAMKSDVIINEILFNPHPGAADYVELFNPGDKIIDAAGLYLATRHPSGAISSPKKLFPSPYYLFPGEYLVVTEDMLSMEQHYFVKNRDAICLLPALPSYPDTEGTIVLANDQGVVVDEVSYDEDWHFALIANREGIALERMNPLLPSGDRNNWHSAAQTAGFGTPGYQNSQLQRQTDGGKLQVSPPIFSPDNDGHDDIASIHYQLAESGYVANVFILDAGGRSVRHLVKSALLALEGSWNWDGLGEKREQLPTGPYIVFTQLFNLDGRKKEYKSLVVLARKH
ncbi:MAG TPA: lamin tail domain-containing protein [Flavisolibacter sp.]|nr:lamin tail domain-containing protein [Flavisolibacter sp.]